MLKQMRWRFIGAAMAAFTAVVLTLLCFVNLWNYHSMTDQQDEALARLLEVEDQRAPFSREKDAPPFDDWAHFSPEVQYSLRFFSVHYDADGTVLRVDQDHVASLSEEDAKAYADAALAHQKAQGYESGYRYLVHTTDQETVVLFLNSERELQRMHSLLWITLVIAGVCLVVVFALVVLLSRRAILPYLKNMEAQKQFITNASHELKTPLMAIQGYAEGIQAGVMDAGGAAEVILAESDRMTELVEELLDISKIDMGRQLLAFSEMDVRELLYDSIRAVEPAAAGGIAIVPDFPEEPVMVSCDDTRLRRAVTNILSNGVRYARSELRLTCRADKRHVTIRIQDDGDGIAEADLPHIFDRFYMGRSGKSGIGLALTKEIIHLHRGTIRAYNGDSGAVFEITLPAGR